MICFMSSGSKINLFFFVFVAINLFVLVLIVFHEKLLNTIDMIKMPINQELCKVNTLNMSRNKKLNLKNMSFDDVERELRFLKIERGGKKRQQMVRRQRSGKRNHSQSLWPSSNASRVAIIVPYRDREANLHMFLLYLHQFLATQPIHYGIYLVEPLGHLRFNRAMLINVGFVESLRDHDNWTCFIFHDVDMLPENRNNVYDCDQWLPKQMAISINTYSYSVNGYFKNKYFGGVNAFTKQQFKAINGFSNSYFGWGIEDDDARLRVFNKFSNITRLSSEVGKYFANCHDQQERNPDRFVLYMSASSRVESDGLNSLTYQLVRTQRTPLYTKFLVTYTDKP